MRFSIAIRIEGIERRQRSIGLLHVVTACFLVAKTADYYRYQASLSFLALLPFYLVALASLVYGLFRRRLDPVGRHNRNLRLLQALTFAVLAVLMTQVGKSIDYWGLFLWTGLSILLMFSEQRLFRGSELVLADEGISLSGLLRSHLVPWTVIASVVVRQDFITIFHRDQKYLQYPVAQVLTEGQVAELNHFCSEKIEAAGPVTNENQ